MSNQVLEVMKRRSSARAYSEVMPTKEELDIILEAGLQAPTGMNRQEIRFSVINGNNPILEELDEEKRKLRGQEKQPHNFYYEAPVLIFLSAEDGFKWSKVCPWHCSAEYDVGCGEPWSWHLDYRLCL